MISHFEVHQSQERSGQEEDEEEEEEGDEEEHLQVPKEIPLWSRRRVDYSRAKGP